MSDKEVVKTENTQKEVAPRNAPKQKFAPKGKNNRDRANREDKPKDPFETKLISVKRVTKMFKGGRRMKLSVFVAVGDKKGRVGLGIGKGDDVRQAQDKAVEKAKKNLVFIQLKGNTIPHDVLLKFKSARVVIKPAAPGTGIVAGSSMRMVAEVAGVNDMLGKILGTNNAITNAYATVAALQSLKSTRL